MKLFGREAEGHAKALAVLTVVFLVASGLCGLQVVILDSHKNGLDDLLVVFTITGIVELGVMIVSLVGIAVVLITWAFSRVFRSYGKARKDQNRNTFFVTSQTSEGEESEEAKEEP